MVERKSEKQPRNQRDHRKAMKNIRRQAQVEKKKKRDLRQLGWPMALQSTMYKAEKKSQQRNRYYIFRCNNKKSKKKCLTNILGPKTDNS